MNILFFLKPKSEIIYLNRNDSIFDAINTFRKTKFHELPVLNGEGKYVFTLSVADLLYAVKDMKFYNDDIAKKIKIAQIERRKEILPVYIDSEMKDLILLTMSENFVPVLDDRDIFIGIVRRRDIIKYYVESEEFKNGK